MTTLKRTHIRAVLIGAETVMFEIPDWKPGVWIELSKWSIPWYERQLLHPGFRCKVDCNIDALKAEHLMICNWSLI